MVSTHKVEGSSPSERATNTGNSMKLKTVRTSLGQFSDSLIVGVDFQNGHLIYEVTQDELRKFTYMLLDLADDCMCKVRNQSYDDERAAEKIREALDLLQ